jgi:hypothetical protein
MSNTSAPRRMSGASDQPRDHREQSHALGNHRPSRMASQSFARPGDGTSPAAPIAIPRSNVASTRDELSTVASFRLGSRFGDPLGDNAPPIVSTPPVRRSSLSHNFHSGPADQPIHAEVPPRSPSPYEREEVVVQKPQSPITQSIHQRLAAHNSTADPTPRRRETLSEPAAHITTTTIERLRNSSSRTPLHAHVTAESISSPLASEPSSGRKTPVSEAASGMGSQSSATAGHQVKALCSLNPPDPRPPPQSQSFSSPQSGVQPQLSPGSSHTKAKFESIFDPMRSKSTTPTSSKTAAAQVAQGFHPPSLLPTDVTRPTGTEAVSPSESTRIRGPPTSVSAPGYRVNSAGRASKSEELEPQQTSSTGVKSLHVIIPNPVTQSHEQKMVSSPSSTVQEGSIPSGGGSSSLAKLAVPPSKAGKMPSTTETLSSPPELAPAHVSISDPSKSPPSMAMLTQQQRPCQQEVVVPPQHQELQEIRPADPPKKSQPMLTLVPMPGYGSNVRMSRNANGIVMSSYSTAGTFTDHFPSDYDGRRFGTSGDARA